MLHSLSRNDLQSEGAAALAPALAANASLMELNIANNKIGSEGTRPLCEALKVI